MLGAQCFLADCQRPLGKGNSFVVLALAAEFYGLLSQLLCLLDLAFLRSSTWCNRESE
jgi:hypothetical protein